MAQTFQIRDAPVDDFAKIKVLCIGAGLSGILSGIKLPQMIENLELAIYEQSSDIGGTWFDNHYPGYIPAAAYQLSFESNPGWTQYYAPGKEIFDYWKRVTEKYNVYQYITFNTEVIEARWHENEGLWNLQLKDTKTGRIWSDSGNVLISATGILNKWDWPDIPGLHDFKGHLVHTAKWDESYDMTGKRVALIGGGSSGIQILPTIQPIVTHCNHYMKGRTWIAYREPGKEVPGMNPENLENFKHTKEDLDRWAKDPEAYLEFRCAVEDALNSGTDFIVNGSELQTQARALFDEKMRAKLAKKPEVYKALIPEYPPGCRRLTPGPGYLEAIVQDNVEFISNPIEKVTESGIQTEDGKLREVDAIICATGFDTSLKPRFPTYGLGGVTLGEVWDPVPESYLSMCPPKMPNYFMYLGPNGGPGTGSTIILLEQVAEDEPIRQFGQYVDTYMKRVVYGSKCRSWFKRGELDGRVVAVYPGGSMSAIKVMENPRWEDFEWSRSDASDTALNMWAWLGDGTTRNQREGKSTSWYLRNPIFKPKPQVKHGTISGFKEESDKFNNKNTSQEGAAIITDHIQLLQGLKPKFADPVA
ncbi:hypothetical protein B7463_g7911, partial [Scytalidium lignicola]